MTIDEFVQQELKTLQRFYIHWEREMTIDEFVQLELRNLQRFYIYWDRHSAKDPENFPQSDGSDEPGEEEEFSWDEQYDAFCSLILGGEEEI